MPHWVRASKLCLLLVVGAGCAGDGNQAGGAGADAGNEPHDDSGVGHDELRDAASAKPDSAVVNNPKDAASETDSGEGDAAMAEAVCGDGVVAGHELCDDQNADDSDGCHGDCSSSASAITLGVGYACVILADGGVACWGHGTSGNLGNGQTSNQSAPVRVHGLSEKVIALSAGQDHTCAILASGGVQCWGDNGFWQVRDSVGNGDVLEPTLVSGLGAKAIQIGTGESSTCALLANGSVACWGSDFYGEIGDGTGDANDAQKTPGVVPGLAGVMQIAVGGHHTCALLTGGTVKCWGWDNKGQLGDGGPISNSGQSAVPVTVTGLSGVTAIGAGWQHSCALVTGGAVKCWGNGGSFGVSGASNVSGPNPRACRAGAQASPALRQAICTPARSRAAVL